MTATGLGFPATRPRWRGLAHIRAVLAARLWLARGQVWQDGQAWCIPNGAARRPSAG